MRSAALLLLAVGLVGCDRLLAFGAGDRPPSPERGDAGAADRSRDRALSDRPPTDLLAAGGWAKGFGSPLGDDRGNAVAIDAQGNIYFTGQFVGSVSFGGEVLTSQGLDDIVLASYTPAGAHRWSRRYGGTSSDLGDALLVEPGGDLFLGGRSSVAADLGCGQKGGSFLARLGQDGSCRWEVGLGGLVIHAAALAPDGRILLAGHFAGFVKDDFGSMSSAGLNDIFLISLRPDGTVAWQKRLGGAGNDTARSVGVGSSGDVCLTGYSTGNVDLGGGALGSPGQHSFVLRLSAEGLHRWSRAFGDSLNDAGTAVAIDPSGNTYATGSFYGSMDLSGQPLSSVGPYYTDIFLASWDAGGTLRWAKRLGLSPPESAVALSLDGAANVILAASFTDTTDVDGTALTSAGFEDILLASFDANGAHRWSKRLGGSDVEEPSAMALDPAGALVLTGTYWGTTDLGHGPIPNASDRRDAFLVRLPPPAK